MDVSLRVLTDGIMPVVSAQFFVFTLIYFYIVRRSLTHHYRYYVIFLLTIIAFLVTRPIQEFSDGGVRISMLYSRLFILFAAGAPSLFIATSLHCRFELPKWAKWGFVSIGLLLGLCFPFLVDVSREGGGLISVWGGDALSLRKYTELSLAFQLAGAVLLFFFPYLIFLKKELSGDSRKKPLIFISGVLLFGFFMITGVLANICWLYYLGPLASGVLWNWGIFSEISQMACHNEVEESPEEGDELSKSTVGCKEVALATAFIKDNFHQPLQIEDVAKHCGVSASHLMKIFKEEIGMTLNRFLTDVRIEKAKVLLLAKSVTDTAFDVGFNNSNYFSTVFKKQTGTTPRQFQKDHSSL